MAKFILIRMILVIIIFDVVLLSSSTDNPKTVLTGTEGFLSRPWRRLIKLQRRAWFYKKARIPIKRLGLRPFSDHCHDDFPDYNYVEVNSGFPYFPPWYQKARAYRGPADNNEGKAVPEKWGTNRMPRVVSAQTGLDLEYPDYHGVENLAPEGWDPVGQPHGIGANVGYPEYYYENPVPAGFRGDYAAPENSAVVENNALELFPTPAMRIPAKPRADPVAPENFAGPQGNNIPIFLPTLAISYPAEPRVESATPENFAGTRGDEPPNMRNPRNIVENPKMLVGAGIHNTGSGNSAGARGNAPLVMGYSGDIIKNPEPAGVRVDSPGSGDLVSAGDNAPPVMGNTRNVIENPEPAGGGIESPGSGDLAGAGDNAPPVIGSSRNVIGNPKPAGGGVESDNLANSAGGGDKSLPKIGNSRTIVKNSEPVMSGENAENAGGGNLAGNRDDVPPEMDHPGSNDENFKPAGDELVGLPQVEGAKRGLDKKQADFNTEGNLAAEGAGANVPPEIGNPRNTIKNPEPAKESAGSGGNSGGTKPAGTAVESTDPGNLAGNRDDAPSKTGSSGGNDVNIKLAVDEVVELPQVEGAKRGLDKKHSDSNTEGNLAPEGVVANEPLEMSYLGDIIMDPKPARGVVEYTGTGNPLGAAVNAPLVLGNSRNIIKNPEPAGDAVESADPEKLAGTRGDVPSETGYPDENLKPTGDEVADLPLVVGAKRGLDKKHSNSNTESNLAPERAGVNVAPEIGNPRNTIKNPEPAADSAGPGNLAGNRDGVLPETGFPVGNDVKLKLAGDEVVELPQVAGAKRGIGAKNSDFNIVNNLAPEGVEANAPLEMSYLGDIIENPKPAGIRVDSPSLGNLAGAGDKASLEIGNPGNAIKNSEPARVESPSLGDLAGAGNYAPPVMGNPPGIIEIKITDKNNVPPEMGSAGNQNTQLSGGFGAAGKLPGRAVNVPPEMGSAGYQNPRLSGGFGATGKLPGGAVNVPLEMGSAGYRNPPLSGGFGAAGKLPGGAVNVPPEIGSAGYQNPQLSGGFGAAGKLPGGAVYVGPKVGYVLNGAAIPAPEVLVQVGKPQVPEALNLGMPNALDECYS